MRSENYWTQRYNDNNTGWDVGYPTTPIKEYINQLNDKSIKILIPGGGNSYEAEYLYDNGFYNVVVIDISNEPLINLKNRVPHFPSHNIIHGDFFNHNEKYDLIIEQTFFCAIDPKLRIKYKIHIHHLLKQSGCLIGLLFDKTFDKDGPPYGGSKEEYLTLFSDRFQIAILETAYNSIPSRQGSELFVKLEKEKIKT